MKIPLLTLFENDCLKIDTNLAAGVCKVSNVAREVDSGALLCGEVEGGGGQGGAPPRPLAHGLPQHQPLLWLPLPLQRIVTYGKKEKQGKISRVGENLSYQSETFTD